MKKIVFILLIMFLFSCEKETPLQCEKDQTFTLVLMNSNSYVDSLIIGDKSYKINSIQYLTNYTISIKDIKTICIVRNTDKYKIRCEYMIGRPNACATYNYFF